MEVTPQAPSVVAGSRVQLSAVALDENENTLKGRTITWSSENTAVATVDATGMVHGVSVGTVGVVATAQGRSGRSTVTVTPPPIASLAFEPAAETVQRGSTVTLRLVARDAAGTLLTGRPVTLSTSDPTIATVSSNLVVTGVGLGTATITATAEGKTATVAVTVIPVPIASLAIEPPSPTLEAGSAVNLRVVARDAAGNELAGRTVTLSTSDAAVATVSAGGVVSGVSPGTATITATAEGRTATAVVRVVPVQIASLAIDPPSATLEAGSTVNLRVIARDAAGSELAGRTVTLSTSDAAVAAVSAGGVVTAVAPGTATITATAEGRNATATITVVPASIASLAFEPATATVQTGANVTLNLVARSATGAVLVGRAATLSSSDVGVARVSAGGVVSGVSPGTATITATAEGKTATAAITVVPVPIASLAIEPPSATLEAGSTVNLRVVARDAAGSELAGRTVTLSTSDAAVATVSAGGVVTAVAPGTATITATAEGRNATATITVVPASIASLAFEPATATVQTGANVTLNLVARSATGTVLVGRAATLFSSNTGVARVSAGGVVSGVSPGTATITATAEGKTATAVVRVVPPNTAFLTEVPGTVLDAKLDRVLWRQQVGTSHFIKLRTAATGADVTIYNEVGADANLRGFLFSGGVLFAGMGGWYEWRNGAVTALTSAQTIAVDRDWAAWVEGGVYRRDLSTGTTTVVPGTAQQVFSRELVDVGPNGDVVYVADSVRVYRDGATSAVAAGTFVASDGRSYLVQDVQTDGVNVVYSGREYNGSFFGICTVLNLDRPGGDVTLARQCVQGGAGFTYRVNGGWIAYNFVDGRVQRRSPAGVVETVAPSGQVRALSPEGSVIVSDPALVRVAADGTRTTLDGSEAFTDGNRFLVARPDGRSTTPVYVVDR